MKRVLLLLVLMLMVLAVQALSQVTLSYDGVVTSSEGPHAAVFPRGERVAFTYTLDPTATDSNSDPQRGVFSNAVLSMSISFPGLGVFANSGPSGTLQTFDNVMSTTSSRVSDQVFVIGGPISSASLLEGESISQSEVDFLNGFICAPPLPAMISSDAIPLFNLPLTDSFVIFRTASGTTFVNFAARPQVRVQALIDEVEAFVTAGRLTRAQADRLIVKLEAVIRALDRGNTGGACSNLQTFVERVNGLLDDGVVLGSRGQAIIDSARSIRRHIGC
jgi:hypothetical protein